MNKDLETLEFEREQIDLKIEENQNKLKDFNLAIFELQPEISKVIDELELLKNQRREITEKINFCKKKEENKNG